MRRVEGERKRSSRGGEGRCVWARGVAQQCFVLVVGAEWGWGGHGLSWSFLRRIGATLYLDVHVME